MTQKHMRSSIQAYRKVRCGRGMVKDADVVMDWALVTCKHCQTHNFVRGSE